MGLNIDGPYSGCNPKAFQLSKEWRQNVELARAQLEKAKSHMKKWADENRRLQEFIVGDLVIVKLLPEQLRFLRNRDKRLVRKYEGPVPVVAKIGPTSYRIEPPKWMTVHPVFHVSKLNPYNADESDASRNITSRPAVTGAPPVNQGVEEILAERVVKSTKRPPHKEYLIKWNGLGVEETSWEKE
ncbi:hypothetical protein MANES_10G083832v8 [Manihot esculenta]|uniref:Uncharacterized protein n=1 Tax=Manihot esculenta TaxID=3983 RepID=A0ACB7GZ55_MANES|nr:hypothetical protein MANES_10G083832v8 [Manihot esculenta]